MPFFGYLIGVLCAIALGFFLGAIWGMARGYEEMGMWTTPEELDKELNEDE